MCAAPVGNRFWEARSTHGRKPIFSDSDQLWNACSQYFQWVEDNPLWEMKSYMYQGAPVQDQIPKMRAMTIGGLCIFLDIDQTTWKDYERNKDFSRVVTAVTEIIKNQKFTGAAADLLNANIIARDLGLADKQEHTGADGTPLIPEVSDMELARRAALLFAQAKKEIESK